MEAYAAMRVRIVIITKNQRPFLERTLPGIAAQKNLAHPAEIVVVDSGSTDGAQEYVQSFPEAKLVCLHPKEFGYARAHNVGAVGASADVLVRLSGDAVPASDTWLATLIAPFASDPAVALTWGRQILPPGNHNPIERGMDLLAGTSRTPRRITRPCTVLGCCMAVRRDLWERCPYDERLPQAEDFAWMRYWLRRGYAGVHVPVAAVIHGHDESLGRALRRSTVQTLLQISILSGILGRGEPPPARPWQPGCDPLTVP